MRVDLTKVEQELVRHIVAERDTAIQAARQRELRAMQFVLDAHELPYDIPVHVMFDPEVDMIYLETAEEVGSNESLP